MAQQVRYLDSKVLKQAIVSSSCRAIDSHRVGKDKIHRMKQLNQITYQQRVHNVNGNKACTRLSKLEIQPFTMNTSKYVETPKAVTPGA